MILIQPINNNKLHITYSNPNMTFSFVLLWSFHFAWCCSSFGHQESSGSNYSVNSVFGVSCVQGRVSVHLYQSQLRQEATSPNPGMFRYTWRFSQLRYSESTHNSATMLWWNVKLDSDRRRRLQAIHVPQTCRYFFERLSVGMCEVVWRTVKLCEGLWSTGKTQMKNVCIFTLY